MAAAGNPVKFALGFTSMLFDIVFMAQHWLLYPASSRGGRRGGADGDKLLGDAAAAAAAATGAGDAQATPEAAAAMAAALEAPPIATSQLSAS